MKRVILGTMALTLLLSGCKLFQPASKTEAANPQTETTTTETKVFSVPAPKNNIRENPTSDVMYEQADKPATGKPVSMRSENFTLSPEDQASYGNQSFFVIVGSFSSNDNANRFKKDLMTQGFSPIILHSETGYYRVCVDSYTEEAAARSRVRQIRTDYPQYADSWLLIKK